MMLIDAKLNQIVNLNLLNVAVKEIFKFKRNKCMFIDDAMTWIHDV